MLYIIPLFLIIGCSNAIWMLNLNAVTTEPEAKLEHAAIPIKDGEAKNLVDLAESLGLSILVKALEETGMDNVIDHEGKFTLFAPTNEAFKRIPEWAKDLPLKEVLRYHIARGLYYDKDLQNDMKLRTLLTKRDLRINLYDNGQTILAGGKRINGSNYEAHNGVLHLLEDVIVSIPARHGTVIHQLRRCPVFSDLVELIDRAGLDEALQTHGPITFFAPSNDVIRKLPPDVIKHLVDDPALLKEVLTYHVLSGTFYSPGIKDGMEGTTMQGKSLIFSIKDGEVIINSKTKVTSADSNASNGVIHSIDNVLIPPQIQAKLKRRILKKSRAFSFQ
uniref:Embryo cathepsin L-associated protein n=1 Tax=Artemia franciscana TaxID=6661 RepID=Q6W7F4_ARTSF|nr:embryo cathepsin L-associated protein [Artemia franciscana]